MKHAPLRSFAAALALAPALAAAQDVQHGVTPLVLQWETADWGPPTDRPGFPVDP